MPNIIQGDFDGRGLRVAVVVSRFNNFISERLLEGALDALQRHGVEQQRIDVIRVPGSFELPLAVKALAEQKKYDALVVLGCLVRGGTAHFDLIAAELFKGVAALELEYRLALGMGVITADNLEQAIERAGTKMGNKGFDAALTAIEMASLMKQLGHQNKTRG